MSTIRLRLSRPGLAVRGHGPGPRHVLACRRRRLRGGRRRPRRVRSARSPGTARPSGSTCTENAQPALLAASIAILEAMRERWASSGLAAPRARLRGRPLDGPVLGARRRRRPVARGRRPPRPRARPADAGLRPGPRRRDGRAHRPRRRELPELVAAASAHGTFVVANRNAPGQVVVSGERAAIEAGAEIARDLGAKRAIVLPVSVAAHSPLMAEAADGDARDARRHRLPRPDHHAPRQRRRPPDHDGRRAPGPSSSST